MAVFVLSRDLARIAHAATRRMMLQRDRRYLALDPATYESLAPKVLEALSGVGGHGILPVGGQKPAR